ncbi:MAG: type II secretion system F family protein [Chloroflexi bacterium]|nr:type II secretion system F family protein [Chloroflexota bacterium]
MSLLAAGTVALALIFMVLAWYVWATKTAQRVEARLSRVSTLLRPQEIATERKSEAPARRTLAGAINRRIARRGLGLNLAQALSQADLKMTPGEYLLVMLLAAIITFALIWLLSGQVIGAIGVGAITFYLPIWYLGFRRRQRSNSFNSQLADTANLLIGSLRSGYSLMQAIEGASRESPSPTREELGRVVLESNLGVSAEEALDHLVERLSSRDLDLMVTAININRETRGNLIELLDALHETLTDSVRIKGEVAALTASVTMSSCLIAILPVAIAGFMFLFNPSYIQQIPRPGPFLCFSMGAAVSLVIGFVITRKIATVEA